VTEVSQVHGDPQRFQAEVWFQDRCWGTGRGRSRKLAEQQAAQVAYGAMTAEGIIQPESPTAE
jgi:ribonuclease-3